jgi:hypothetical protein
MKKIYLAAPYSSPDAAVREERFRLVNIMAGNLMREGYCVFSPISHSHPIAELMDDVDNCDHDFWLKQDMSFLRYWADELWVLQLPGWNKSRGVEAEINKAVMFGIKIRFIKPEDGSGQTVDEIKVDEKKAN